MAIIDSNEPLRNFISSDPSEKGAIKPIMYLTNKNSKDEYITREIKVNKIVNVFIDDELVDTFVEYECLVSVVETKFFFFKKTVTKMFKPTPSYYSGDVILTYNPVGVLPSEILRDNIRDSMMYYKDNMTYVDSLHYLNPLRD